MEHSAGTNLTAPPVTGSDRKSIAPIWHTVLFLAVLFALSIPAAHSAAPHNTRKTHIVLYLSTIVMEWLYVAYIAWGLRLRGRTLRDLIGGRWDSAETVVTDLVLGACFFVLNVVLRAIIVVPLFALSPGFKNKADETMRIVQSIGPGTLFELFLFMALALTAGICEEIMFRGYLQQQIIAWTGSAFAGVVVSTAVFGVGHAYQGWFGAVVVTSYGVTLAVLAVWRRSLRPGMIAHAWQDVVAGLLTHALARIK